MVITAARRARAPSISFSVSPPWFPHRCFAPHPEPSGIRFFSDSKWPTRIWMMESHGEDKIARWNGWWQPEIRRDLTSWGNGSWNPINFTRFLAPSKRWLTLGFLNHQPEWSLLSCVISINRKQSHRTDWVNEISSWWEIMMDPCWYSDDTDWIYLPNPGCQWQMKV